MKDDYQDLTEVVQDNLRLRSDLASLGDRPPFINRELSWMCFNERVLEEARDKHNPLYERLNFLAITCSNLDEFCMVRLGSLHTLMKNGDQVPDKEEAAPSRQIKEIFKQLKTFTKLQYSTYSRQILPALAKEQIQILSMSDLTATERNQLETYFQETIVPVLTPMAVDSSRPFPLIANHSLNLYVGFASRQDQPGYGDYPPFALVQIPTVLRRLVKVKGREHVFVLLEDLVTAFIDQLFSQMKIVEVTCFRISRNADFAIDEDETDDLLEEMEDKLRQRQWGSVIRLEIEDNCSEEVLALLKDLLKLEKGYIVKIRGPLDLQFVRAIPDLIKRSDLNFPAFTGQPAPAFAAEEPDYFQIIRDGDVILHHPYESFAPVTDIIRRASCDPQVLAIKQTLYRVSGQAPIVSALAEAARKGKQVFVLVELKARFDEERNIHWAKSLEQAGCHVIYGLKGLKTHSKITLIVRQEEEGIRRYVHLGTGNYNDQTAKIYTDFGLWTASEAIGADATVFFNMLSGYSLPLTWRKLVPAPRWLMHDTLAHIQREIDNARQKKPAYIIAKMNSLVDKEIIRKLYEASQAGVKISLIVRGICCLRPGVVGLSENIEVRSLVGRFLEHSRIFYYHNDGASLVYLSSADWMPRNLKRRIELLFPVEDQACRARVLEVLALELADTERARLMQPDGSYQRIDRRGKTKLDSQVALCQLAVEAAKSPELADLDHYQVQAKPLE